ncbi:hypothetical protein GCM10010435_55930 [Winogradskya consettensis]|uniref:Tetratricopeptide repeat protein n=1 Tax=Winogradskya consettensis TaxID=113560 RepID=A0A919VS60_9ACTN|nr:tetratricopeptide repeat protein [Actinoplanes consettensis]GIM67450.1 hypothetical protein Aco04nite_06390 [Actinoplanes consettensis]
MRDTLSQAKELVGDGRFADAVQLLEGLLAEHPEDAVAWHRLAGALIGLERNEEAVAAADRSIALDPAVPAAHRMRALAHLGLKQWTELRADAGRALALDPDDAEALTLAAQGELGCGADLGVIEPLVTRARRIKPAHPAVASLTVLIRKARFLAAGVACFIAALALALGWLALDPSGDGVAPHLMWALLVLIVGGVAGTAAGNAPGLRQVPLSRKILILSAAASAVVSGATTAVITREALAGLVVAVLAVVLTVLFRLPGLIAQARNQK